MKIHVFLICPGHAASSHMFINETKHTTSELPLTSPITLVNSVKRMQQLIQLFKKRLKPVHTSCLTQTVSKHIN